MAGYDWNKNGKKDMFDTYIDMKIMSKISKEDNNEEVDEDDDFGDDFVNDIEYESNRKELKGISMGGKVLYDATKDSNAVSILKCVLVTLFCIGGIVLPVATDMGTIGTLICIFGGVGLSVLILKNV